MVETWSNFYKIITSQKHYKTVETREYMSNISFIACLGLIKINRKGHFICMKPKGTFCYQATTNLLKIDDLKKKKNQIYS